MIENVWIFHGAESNFTSGAFTDKDIAEGWIKQYKLTGTLSLYPLNKGVYDWAIQEGIFTPTKEYQYTGEFVQKFNSASQEHYHYSKGLLED
jgi:hypothetical protein